MEKVSFVFYLKSNLRLVGENPNRSETFLLPDDDPEIVKIWHDDSYELHCKLLNGYVLINRTPKQETLEPLPYSCVAVAAIITAKARVS